MDSKNPVLLTASISRDEFKGVIADTIKSNSDLSEQFDAALKEVQARYTKAIDELEAKLRDAVARVEAKTDSLGTKKEEIDRKLEELKKKIESRVNTYVIPGALLVFITIALALFATSGGFDSFKKLQGLKADLDTATDQFKTTNANLQALTKSVDGAAALSQANATVALTTQITSMSQQLNKLTAELDSIKKSQKPSRP